MAKYCVINPLSENEGYGIKVISVRYVYDISSNLRAIEGLCARCNENDVDPVHFDDVLEDFLSQEDCL